MTNKRDGLSWTEVDEPRSRAAYHSKDLHLRVMWLDQPSQQLINEMLNRRNEPIDTYGFDFNNGKFDVDYTSTKQVHASGWYALLSKDAVDSNGTPYDHPILMTSVVYDGTLREVLADNPPILLLVTLMQQMYTVCEEEEQARASGELHEPPNNWYLGLYGVSNN